VVYPLEQGAEVLRGWRAFAETAPESLSVWCVTRHAPPLPFLPEHSHGRKVVVLALACTAPEAEREALVAPLLRLGTPYGSFLAPQPYAQWQKVLDPLLAAGARNYWKSHNFNALPDEVLDAVVSFGEQLPAEGSEIFIAHIAGAPNRVARDTTAYAQRDARFVMNVHGRWARPAEDAAGMAWARGLFAACAPHASAGAYTNFLTADEAGRVEAAYGSSLARLQRLKHHYDPQNVFHLNPNVSPKAA